MISREQQQEQFLRLYEGLNAQQKEAVDKLEGPVMVIAGPGTGKTQILGARIGKLRLETDIQPENILCLTYTDAGVVAMRKRLVTFIGPDAYKVNIGTFHSFCNDVIQDNLSYFDKTTMDPISDLERIALMKELIDGFGKNHPLKRYRGDIYHDIKNLEQLFSSMKREGLTADYIEQCIDAHLNDLPNKEGFTYKRKYKQFNAGDLKEAAVAEEQEKMEKLRAAVKEFDRFQQLMHREKRYDFDDMINWVIRLFNEQSNILLRYQEQYQYIMVDEFQDTSGTQNRLVEQLISYWDEPNIFVVGDDDQSIYRFQGANVENMESFASKYIQSLKTIILTNNYRSTQPILDIARTLIEHNNDRLVNKIPGLSKVLVAANEKRKGATQQPIIREYASPREEMIHVTYQVKQLLETGIASGHIAVIYRENRYGEELAQYFQQKDIPVFSKRNINLLQEPLTQQLVNMLRYIDAEHDVSFGGDEMLFEILHYHWFGIPAIEIAKLSAEVAERRFGDKPTSLRQLIAERVQGPAPDLFSKEIPGLAKAQGSLEKLITAVPNLTLQQLFMQMVSDTGAINHIMHHSDKHWLLQVLTGLFDFIREETHRKPLMPLSQLISTFDLMEKENLALPLVRVTGNEEAVNLLTAHGSKGLEFRHVFLVGCNSQSWEKKKKNNSGFSMPDTVFTTQSNHSEEEELRRLFYVAITRAEHQLCMSYTTANKDGKNIEPSMFLEEIRAEHQLPFERIRLNADEKNEFAALAYTKKMIPELGRVEADFITRLLDRFVMNVTALNNYLKCPLQFYFNNLVRVPTGKSEATEFGSAVHHALHQLFLKMQQQNNRFPDKESFIADFEWYMKRHRENFTKEQFTRRIEYGQNILSNYYEQYVNEWNPIVAVETNIRHVSLNGIPLKGKLDKLEFDGKRVNVVDYKTGNPENGMKKLLPPNDKDPHGGDYWRQAVFYKILVDNNNRNWEVVSSEFDFVEPDKKKNYTKAKLVIRDEDVRMVSEQITMVWEKIQQRDFYTGCGKEECHWCNFVKTNELASVLHEPREEETDD